MAEYTFYPKFQEFVTLYRGVVRVWIGNGIDTGTAGMLYAEYIDGLVQQLGMVSDYEEAKKYFADLGVDLSYEEWIERLIQMPENAHDAHVSADNSETSSQQSEAWAVGQRQGTDVPSTDPTYHNNAKYYSGNAYAQATNSANSAAAALASEQAAQTAQSLAETAQGLAETAQGLAEDAQSAAETAQSAAETAQGLAEDAQAAAETAQSLSETAQGLAETAQAAAETAQSLAETAQSAAETAQGAAETAQTAAETAQSLAETAQTAAETARAGAETAESGAEGFEDSAEAWAVGQINGSDVSNLDPRYHNNSKYYSEQASNFAVASQTSSEIAEGWATGDYGGTASATNNAKYFSQQANISSIAAADSKTNAETSSLQAEAWAVGQKDGADVPQTDQTYHNNSKYYCTKVYEKFDELDRVLSSTVTKYQNSTDGHNPPVGGVWTDNPNPINGKFTWSQTTFTWDNGDTTVLYNVTYIGVNGNGAVDSVNGLAGDVVLDAANICYDAYAANPETLQTRLAIISDEQIDDLFDEDEVFASESEES